MNCVPLYISHKFAKAFSILFFLRLQIKLKEIFESESQLFLILELVTGGELFDRYVLCLNLKDSFILYGDNSFRPLESNVMTIFCLMFQGS